MDNQHQKIDGYRDFDQNTVDIINGCKALEKSVAELVAYLRDKADADPRELALARTHIEQGFMHMVKAVAKPETPWK